MPPPPRDGYADWQEIARGWERGRALLWEATRPVSEWLVARLAPAPGETVLELAAGTGETGFLAAPALLPGGRLISSDRSPNMVAAARRLAADLGLENVEFRTLDSERTGLAPESVDGVLSRFGYLLRGSPPAALAETRRILRPDGRLAFAVWGERHRNGWMTVPTEVMVALGHIDPPGPDELAISARRTPERIAAMLERYGLAPVAIEEMRVAYRFDDADQLWQFVSELRGPLSLVLAALDPDEQVRVRAAIEARAEQTAGGGFELGGVSIVALATAAQATTPPPGGTCGAVR